MHYTKPAQYPSNNFDALRLLAALAVLYSHQYPVTATPPPLWMNVAMIGGVAVMTFFVISGYLVTLSWQTHPRLWLFIGKRVLRIWPALIVVVLLASLALGPSFTTLSLSEYVHHGATWDYLRNIQLQTRFLLPGVFATNPLSNSVNGPLWTIPIEVSCYAILAACGFFGLLRWQGVWLLACIGYLAWFLTNKTMDLTGIMDHHYEFPAYFAFGSLIATFKTQFLQHRWRYALLASVIAAATYLAGFKYSALLLFLPAILISIGTSSWPVLSQAGRFGDVSYGVYLYAFPIQQSVYALWPDLGFTASLFIVTVLTLIAGWLSWQLVEAPTLRLKRYLR
ncbi:acyltransferase family protein [Comamonas sp. J-3]|uniref:acyltransferase family protein n=1 Tax=Comamonas trifloxystrobinivorans TaxID=3350256 RepID=UPI00372C6B4C